ncbi:MAG: potassium-transporting ATPase subunit KdpA [Polyangiaceae bacterium]|nr:potassium-transporting ATPase subunit KdpA [Polyangiaceae bacterium]
MTAIAVAQLALFLALLLALARPLGAYLVRVHGGEARLAGRVLGPVERLIYRAAGVRADEDMPWQRYAASVLVFNLAGALALYLLQRAQSALPLNPQGFAAVSPEVSFNTAVSFVTNTNWQAYAGESTMSHLTQMLGLTVQSFVSAATGIAVLFALARGFARQSAEGLGSFWVDLTRATLYVLLPLSVVVALFFVSQGAAQTLAGSVTVHSVQGADQVVSLGPVASQEAIKLIGTNGGGFFNANSAHPFENPTALSNLVQMLSIFLVPAALCFMFGRLVGSEAQGWAILGAMVALFVPLAVAVIAAEQAGNPALGALSVAQQAGNLEGKEVRFGAVGSALFTAVTTSASCGAVNAMLDSFTPLGGLVPMWLMQLGEIVFGGVGSGLYGMLMYAIIAVFVAGLMVGRTPEYLGKKIEAFEMKMASLVILFPAATVLLGTAIACVVPAGTEPLGNPGAHGFSEILYAFTSGTNNNGSAFGGLTASGRFYAVAIGLAMLIGRFWVIVPVLAIAGSLAKQRLVPAGPGTLPTHTPLFVAMLVGTIVLVGALTFLPALALGPIVEHLQQAAR